MSNLATVRLVPPKRFVVFGSITASPSPRESSRRRYRHLTGTHISATTSRDVVEFCTVPRCNEGSTPIFHNEAGNDLASGIRAASRGFRQAVIELQSDRCGTA